MRPNNKKTSIVKFNVPIEKKTKTYFMLEKMIEA